MATVEYFFIKIKDLNNKHIKKDFTSLLKNKIDNLKPNDMHCEGRNCSVLLAEYKENNTPIYNVTFDFSKLTSDTVTSALKYNILENIDTFKDLDEKTLALVKYTEDDIETIRGVLKSSNDMDSLINKLENIDIDFFKIYKVISENNMNRIIQNEDLLVIFHKKHLKRYKKDKTFFNTFKLKDMNVLQLQKNRNGADFRKVERYLNEHVFLDDGIRIIFERIYDSEFMEMLKHQELKHFEITYHSESKTKLLNNDVNSLLFQISDKLGRNNTKISAIADEDSSLNNQKIVEFFEAVNSIGILDECRLKQKAPGNNSFIGSNDKGSILQYTSQYKMENLEVANLVFLDSYKAKEDILSDRIL